MLDKFFRRKEPNYQKAKEIFKENVIGNNLVNAEKKLKKLCDKYPENSLKYKKAFFSVIKDIDKKIAVKYGEEIIKEDFDPKFIQVLATRYKWLGNQKRYNQLMNKLSPLPKIKEKLDFFIQEKKTFGSIKKYIDLKIKEYPEYELEIKEIMFSKLKDIYTKEVIPYAEEVLQKKQKNKNFIKVLATRYKRIGDFKKYRALNHINKKFIFQEFKKELLSLIETKTPINQIVKSIDEEISLFPNKKLPIAKVAFGVLKDKYTRDSLRYGEIVIENKKDISFLQVFLTRCKKIRDEEKVYKYSKIAYDLTKDSKYMNDILMYENKETIEKLQKMLRNNQEQEVEKEIAILLNNFKEYKDIIFTIASEIYADFNIFKSIDYMKKAIEVNPNENLYLKLFSLYIKKGDLKEAINQMPENITNKTLQTKINIWKGNVELLEKGFELPIFDKSSKYERSKNILYLLHNTLPFHSGGYATRAHGLMEGTNSSSDFKMQGVSRLGYPKDILKLDSDDDILEREVIDGIVYRRLKSNTRRGNTTYYEYIKEYGEKVVELAKKEKPFVIHAASNLYNGLAGVYAAKKLGIKSIYEIRGLWEITRISREPEWKDTDMYKFNAKMETTAALNADVVITITQALKDEMVKRGVPAEKIEILPNGVVSDRFKPLDKNKKLAEKLNIRDKVVIGFIGSFAQYEGLEYIVDAVEILINKGKKDIVALMVGDGAVWQDIVDIVERKGLQEYFIFTGRIPHEEVENYYSLVDIAPLPRKGLPVCEMVSPLKPFEAMAMEKVVLASNVAALAEIVQDSYNGMLFEKDNIEDLADKIELLANDEKLREKLGKQAREWVIKERDWKVLSEKLVNIYKRLYDE